jgi:hypothetical protein
MEHSNPIYRTEDILEDTAVNFKIIRGHRTVKTSVMDPCHFGMDLIRSGGSVGFFPSFLLITFLRYSCFKVQLHQFS